MSKLFQNNLREVLFKIFEIRSTILLTTVFPLIKAPGDYLFPKLLGAAPIKGRCSFRSK